jgi:hypothetical protein
MRPRGAFTYLREQCYALGRLQFPELQAQRGVLFFYPTDGLLKVRRASAVPMQERHGARFVLLAEEELKT